MSLPKSYLCGEITVMDYTLLRLFISVMILGIKFIVASLSRPVDGYVYWEMGKMKWISVHDSKF
jgi:hypothetical protein